MFPWLARWIKNRELMVKHAEMTIKDLKDLVDQLKNTVNPQNCRGLVDCFLIRKQKDEVRRVGFSVYLVIYLGWG